MKNRNKQQKICGIKTGSVLSAKIWNLNRPGFRYRRSVFEILHIQNQRFTTVTYSECKYTKMPTLGAQLESIEDAQPAVNKPVSHPIGFAKGKVIRKEVA